MKARLLVCGLVIVFLLGFTANSFATLLVGTYEETYWPGPGGNYNYGSNPDSYTDLGIYRGTGLQGSTYFVNMGDDTILNYFINTLGYASASSVSALAVTSGPDNYAGTWKVTANPPSGGDYVDFIVVKGGTSLSFHEYIPAALGGLWNVGYLADAGNSGKPSDMSFVRAYNSTPVPEPASMLLMGSGLLAYGIFRKKRNQKKG